MHKRPHLLWLVVPVALFGCAKADVNPGGDTGGSGGRGGSGGGGTGGRGGTGGDPFVNIPQACMNDKCSDFPAEPIIEGNAPANAAGMFSGAPSGAGPCVIEPEDGTLFPRNWLRPRVRWTGASGVAQVKISSPRQDKELVAYTAADHFVIPKNIWTALGGHARADEDITVAVRVAGGGATTLKFRIASVDASGSMVFWAVKPTEVDKDPTTPGAENDSELRGFAVGDESTVSALTVPQVKQPGTDKDTGGPRPARCIGCHVATPDGQHVAFVDHWPWNLSIANVKQGSTGNKLPDMTVGGEAGLRRSWSGMPTVSPLHWKPGERIIVTASSLTNPTSPWEVSDKKPAQLVWFNLDAAMAPMMSGNWVLTAEGAQFGTIKRTGDPNYAAAPSWGHTKDVILYSSTPLGGNQDGRLAGGPGAAYMGTPYAPGKTDLYTVPYNSGMGGDAKPVPGASDAAWEEYYAAFSKDDRLIVYNRIPAGEIMYANPKAELFVVPAEGGTPIRLKANDPPACSGKKSPGINNHWARWSPSIQTTGAGTFYWLIFSSNRAPIAPVRSSWQGGRMVGAQQGKLVEVSQLYVTPVFFGAEGGIETFPAIYLWNQPTATVNTTPVWETIEIPPVE